MIIGTDIHAGTGTNIQSVLRLWQLISPALPVGAYAYSQGLESAVERGWVDDEQSTYDWLSGIMLNSLASLDLPVAVRLFRAFKRGDDAAITYWNQYLLASRETAELRLEDVQLGQALARLLAGLGVEKSLPMSCDNKVAYLTMFSLAAVEWAISEEDMLMGFLWAWCENQVSVAIKLVPLGQTSGQRILSQLIVVIPQVLAQGAECGDDQISSSIPGLVIASAGHEIQYSRLFRS